MNRRHLLAVLLAAGSLPSQAQRLHPHMRVLRDLLRPPVDYGQAKLAIDALVDPGADVSWAAGQLDRLGHASSALAQQARREGADDVSARIMGIRTCLYRAGPWNEGRAFGYDLNRNLRDRDLGVQLLPHYLRHRLGDCVSMPTLFLALAQRAGLDVALAEAPQHLLVKVRDGSGAWHNLECTDRAGFKSDASYIREMEISPQAMANRLYLQPLTGPQAVVAMFSTLGAAYWRNRDARSLHALADRIQEARPGGLGALLMRKSALDMDLEVQYVSRYGRWEDMPPSKAQDARGLIRQILGLEARAQALGWRRPSEQFELAYRRSVDSAIGDRRKAASIE